MVITREGSIDCSLVVRYQSVSRARIVDVVQINVREQAWHWHSIQQCHGLIALYNRSINVIPYMDMFLSHEMIDELIKIYVFFSI